MKTKAAVLYEANTPMVIETVDLQEPQEGEVLVKVAAAGVCHSDFHIMKGEWAWPMPAILGHEGAGIVERVGPGVTPRQAGSISYPELSGELRHLSLLHHRPARTVQRSGWTAPYPV